VIIGKYNSGHIRSPHYRARWRVLGTADMSGEVKGLIKIFEKNRTDSVTRPPLSVGGPDTLLA
jgi:hypothetical protein